jgi:Flp pilus assembly protein TadG
MSRVRSTREAGQAMTEFALVAPLFFLVLFGVIQLGFLFAGQNGLTNAAREAARYASTLPTPDGTVSGNCSTSGTNSKAVHDRLLAVSLPQYIPGFRSGNLTYIGALSACSTAALATTGTGVGYCADANGDGTYAVRVRITVVYRHPLFIPLVGRIFSSTDTLQLLAAEEMRVEGPNRSTAGGFVACP